MSEPKYQKAFNQLKERLEIYYPKKAKIMTKVLSIISKNKQELTEQEILNQVENDEEEVKSILYDLLEDHYLLRTIENGERKYSFKYEIFKEWWKINIV